MKTLVAMIAALLLSAGSAFALPPELGEKNCKDFRDEFLKFLAQESQGDATQLFEAARRSPVAQLVQTAMADLDETSVARIEGPLIERFGEACLVPKRYAPQDITVAAAFDIALTSLQLDRSLPRWGLIDLPEIDFDTQTCMEIVDAAADLPGDVRFNPLNDTFVLAVSHYLQRYDVQSVEAMVLAGGVQKVLALTAATEPSTPCKVLFDRIAAEHGLPPAQ